jgi:large subunit ribosomal protein L10
LKKEQKVSTVNELKEVLDRSNLLVVSDYRGLDVEKISVLRRNCRKSGGSLKVIKNTLARKAVAGTPFAPAEPLLQGPTAVAVCSGDPVAMIKALTSFSKENDVFKIKGGVLDGGAYSAEQLFRIATLPSREVLLARLVGSLASPMSRMVGSLGSPLRGLVGVLQGIKDAKAAQAA